MTETCICGGAITAKVCDQPTCMFHYSHEEIAAARNWIADCYWPDLDDPSELNDKQVIVGISRHYDGGWTQFRADSR